jgi:HAD superfamily hydrolase (TIGR01509 family)
MKPVLVLDLGGVLADLGSPAAEMGLEISDDEFWSLWLRSNAVAEFETGKLDYDEFIRRLIGEFPPEARAVGDRLRNWTLVLYPGVARLLTTAARHFRLAMLSNTNPLHWSQLESAHALFATFEKLFLSYETGLYKPDPESFRQVIDYFDSGPSEIHYFDDSPMNIEVAGKLGIAARRVVGPRDLEAAINALSN